ncbi:MAG: AMP-binding protein [Solirubrobacterales bacterium]|nr:AMP-binding protein [Solirubrobacterales bacterium]
MSVNSISNRTLAFQPEAERFYAEGYWREGDLWSDFATRVERHPDKIALILDDRRVTFAELRRAAIGVSGRLARGGVKPGDVVILLGRHSIEAAVAMLGALHLGAVLAPLPPMFNTTQLSALVAHTGATGLVCFGGEQEIAKCRLVAHEVDVLLAVEPALHDVLPHVEEPGERRPRNADEVTMILHSSGTTSTPKGISHSSNTLRYATEALCRRWQLGHEDVYLVVCEFGFVGGLVFGYLPPLLNGGTGVLVNRWDARAALRLVEQHRCTYLLAMPTHSADLVQAVEKDAGDLSSIRVLAAPGLTRERRIAMKRAFGRPPLGDYGLSEVPGHAAHSLDEDDEKIYVTEGRPYDGTEIRIVDGDEQPLPPGRVGSVVVNGPSRFLGFFGNDELTRESLTDWGGYRTGDLGYLDADGQFVYAGRSKDIIRRGGVTIIPAEVEPVILRHPAVHEVAIVPVPDDRLGERACAAIIAAHDQDPPTLEQLQYFLAAEGVPKYIWPESIAVFEEFPRTPSLKVVKREVAEEVVRRRGRPAT